MSFDRYIGIDYSGAKHARSRTAAIQVYRSTDGDPEFIASPASDAQRRRNWCRAELADWLVGELAGGGAIAAIDHGFSFPIAYFERYDLADWPTMLDDFCRAWPTAEPNVQVDNIRNDRPTRTGTANEFRLVERWTPGAKSVFQFDVQGSVAKSTHAGLPWLKRLRDELGSTLHIWPFDGWSPPVGRSVLAETFPSLFRNRYSRQGRTVDQQDAYAVCRWLQETANNGFLPRYLQPPLTGDELELARREGWILGVA